MTQCFVSLAKRVIIDYAGANGRTQIFGQTLEEVRDRYPDVQIMEANEAVNAIENDLIDAGATEITEQQFTDALEVLPPMKWKSDSDSESFMMAEFFYGSVTSIYARVGNRFYTFYDRCSLSHDDIVRKVVFGQLVQLHAQKAPGQFNRHGTNCTV